MPKRVLALCVAAAIILMPAVAEASTSNRIIYYSDGTTAAGEVWFNSGTSNISRGRNSFTVKDRICDDGWMIFAEYKRSTWNNPLVSWKYTDGASCWGGRTEFDVSIAGDVPREKFIWRTCRQSERDLSIKCTDYVSDYLD